MRYTLKFTPDGYWTLYDDERDGRSVGAYRDHTAATRRCNLLNHLWNRRRQTLATQKALVAIKEMDREITRACGQVFTFDRRAYTGIGNGLLAYFHGGF